MSTPLKKFDSEKYKREMQEYVKYLKCSWELALKTAEECIAPPRQPDDEEVVDIRRAVVYDLTSRIFDKLTFDARDALWQSKEGK